MRKWTPIRYVEGYPPVPHWFTRACHWVWSRRCRRIGHVMSGNFCVHCGQIFAPQPFD